MEDLQRLRFKKIDAGKCNNEELEALQNFLRESATGLDIATLEIAAERQQIPATTGAAS